MSPKKTPALVGKTLDVPDFIEYPILLGKGFQFRCGHFVDTLACTGCTGLQIFAQCAMPWASTRPALGLPRGELAPGLGFALFREAKRVGGRGISDFAVRIFLLPIVSLCVSPIELADSHSLLSGCF